MARGEDEGEEEREDNPLQRGDEEEGGKRERGPTPGAALEEEEWSHLDKSSAPLGEG